MTWWCAIWREEEMRAWNSWFALFHCLCFRLGGKLFGSGKASWMHGLIKHSKGDLAKHFRLCSIWWFPCLDSSSACWAISNFYTHKASILRALPFSFASWRLKSTFPSISRTISPYSSVLLPHLARDMSWKVLKPWLNSKFGFKGQEYQWVLLCIEAYRYLTSELRSRR